MQVRPARRRSHLITSSPIRIARSFCPNFLKKKSWFCLATTRRKNMRSKLARRLSILTSTRESTIWRSLSWSKTNRNSAQVARKTYQKSNQYIASFAAKERVKNACTNKGPIRRWKTPKLAMSQKVESAESVTISSWCGRNIKNTLKRWTSKMIILKFWHISTTNSSKITSPNNKVRKFWSDRYKMLR